MTTKIPPELLLNMVLDSMPVRAFWKDRESRYLGCNQKFAEDAGAGSPAELLGKCDYDFYKREMADAFRADDREVIESGEPKLGIEEPLQAHGGETIWLETNKIPLRDGEGRIVGVLGTYHDISDRIRLRGELGEALARAENANIAKSRFLANMSHELRTPLSSIKAYAEMMQELAMDEGRPQDVKDVGEILSAAQHLLALVGDILDLSKIEAGAMDMRLSEFDIAELVRDVGALVRPMAEQNGNVLSIHADPGLPRCLADQSRLRQCLLNLASNAVKFTKGGVVSIGASLQSRSSGPWLCLEVRDTGIGIAADTQRKLFKRFSQADESATRHFGGTGLGLALSKDLIELMGGEISCESEIGRGSSFRLILPVRPACADPVWREGAA